MRYRKDVGAASARAEAVWIVEGYKPEKLEPVAAGEVTHPPGTMVHLPLDHAKYPGGAGVVMAAGADGRGRVVYDVQLVDTDAPVRLAGSELVLPDA